MHVKSEIGRGGVNPPIRDGIESRIIRTGDSVPGVVEDLRAVTILEQHRPVELAKFAFAASKRRRLDRRSRPHA